MGVWTLELVVCRIATQRKSGGGDHELDLVGTRERHNPYAPLNLSDVLTRLPTQRASEIGQLLPHQLTPAWLTQGELAIRSQSYELSTMKSKVASPTA